MLETVLWRNGSNLTQRHKKIATIKGPAIVLIDPKYPHNVGQVVRAAACYGIKSVICTGNRVSLDSRTHRLPREERMRDYEEVNLLRYSRPFDIAIGTPVAIEFSDNTVPLPDFLHPTDAIYIFGPEDGGLGRPTFQHCHHFVRIPTAHCLNLAAAVATVLYDRMAKGGSYAS